MEEITKIIDILAWPITMVIVVALLRSPLTELVPTLKKLKYKDLEVEFEREANKILSEAERDLPEIPKKTKPESEESRVLFSIERQEPSIEILQSWRNIELRLRKLAENNKLKAEKSIKALVIELESNKLISYETAHVLLDLAALRNKVAHADEEVITYETSSAFIETTNRVMASINKTQQKN